MTNVGYMIGRKENKFPLSLLCILQRTKTWHGSYGLQLSWSCMTAKKR